MERWKDSEDRHTVLDREQSDKAWYTRKQGGNGYRRSKYGTDLRRDGSVWEDRILDSSGRYIIRRDGDTTGDNYHDKTIDRQLSAVGIVLDLTLLTLWNMK